MVAVLFGTVADTSIVGAPTSSTPKGHAASTCCLRGNHRRLFRTNVDPSPLFFTRHGRALYFVNGVHSGNLASETQPHWERVHAVNRDRSCRHGRFKNKRSGGTRTD